MNIYILPLYDYKLKFINCTYSTVKIARIYCEQRFTLFLCGLVGS